MSVAMILVWDCSGTLLWMQKSLALSPAGTAQEGEPGAMPGLLRLWDESVAGRSSWNRLKVVEEKHSLNLLSAPCRRERTLPTQKHEARREHVFQPCSPPGSGLPVTKEQVCHTQPQPRDTKPWSRAVGDRVSMPRWGPSYLIFFHIFNWHKIHIT